MSTDRECWKTEVAGSYPVTLSQQGKNRFTVTYGAEVNRNLSYGEAAAELGACIMHALSCEGRLDAEIPGER